MQDQVDNDSFLEVFFSWQNLVEKVTVKSMGLSPINLYFHLGQEGSVQHIDLSQFFSM